MRRSALAVLLAALCASLLSFTVLPASGEPYPGGATAGPLRVTPETFTAGQEVQLMANFPSDTAGDVVEFFKETSTPGDFEPLGSSDESNHLGNAYSDDFAVDDEMNVFAKTESGGVTEITPLKPTIVNPDDYPNETGTLSTNPSVVSDGDTIYFLANFPSGVFDVTLYEENAGGEWAYVGTDETNRLGNAYFKDYEVEGEKNLFAVTESGESTEVHTVKPVVIDPASCTDNGTLTTSPTKIYDGRDATVIANFPSGSFGVTLFKKKEAGGWSAIGQDASNASGNAFFDDVEFDGTQTLFALNDEGDCTEERTIEPAAPNDVNGGPDELGRNVIYVTTNSGKTPVTKGVDYKGKAVLTSDEVPTETFDLETIAVRGNSSADKPKKPYKLKFDDKQKPFDMKSDKTWILLANYGDWTLVRSMVAWDLGRLLPLGLKWTPNSTFAELYINGKYKGSYQMVESIKIDKNRVNVSKTTGQVIEFDPHWKEDGVPGMVGKTGVDYAWKDPDEFKTLDKDDCVVETNPTCEDPEGLTTKKIADMKAKIREFENVLYGGGNRNWATYRPSTPENDWTTYLDMDSAVDYYLAREFTKDNDADMYRSNFFYTNNVDPASADKFFMGPIWDFDRSAGAKDEPGSTTVSEPTGWWMRGNGSQNHDTNKIHWYTRITDDPRFLNALHDRWAATKQFFEPVGPAGVSAAVRKLGGDVGGINEADVPGDPDYDLGKQVAANDRAIWEDFGGRYHAKTSSYAGELSWVRNWYEERYTWMNAQLSKAPPPLP